MPTREEMIAAIRNSEVAPAKSGLVSKPSREEMIAALRGGSQERNQANDLFDSTITTARSGLEALTFGASEPVISGIQAVADQGYRAAVLNDDPRNSFTMDNIKKSYRDDVERRRAKREEFGVADVAGSVGGALAPVGAGASLARGVSAMGDDAAKAVMSSKLGAKTLDNAVGRTAVKIGKGGAEAAATGGGYEAARQSVGKTTGFIGEGEAPELMDAAKTNAAWGAGFAALPPAFKAAAATGKYAMSTVLGPKVEVINKYLANAERINKAPSIEAIKDSMDEIAIKLQDDIAAGRLSKDEADSVAKAIKQNINQVRTEATQEFGRQKFDVSRSLDDARAKHRDVVKGQEAALKGVRAPLEISGDVENAKRQLKDLVVSGSKGAVDTLPDDLVINMSEVYKRLQPIKDSLNIAGVGPGTVQAGKAQDEINALMNTVGKLPAQLRARDAKKLIQQIDRAEKVIYSSGEFTDEVGQAFRAMRQGLDEGLKAHGPYAEKMKEVAAHTKLLESVNQRFPDQRATQSKVSGLHRPTAKLDYDDLAALSSATGNSFLGDVDEYVNAQQLLANKRKLEAMSASSPEFAAMKAKEAQALRMSSPDASRDFVDGAVKASGLSDDLTAAERRILESEQRLAKAEQTREPFKTLTPGTSENKINAMMRERNPIETKKLIDRLDESFGGQVEKNLGGKLSQSIDDRRVLDTFQKGNTNGSRNVNLMSIMGHNVGVGAGALAGIGGTIGGPVGMFVGAASGAVIDKYGPQMAKGILDATLKIKGSPTAAKIAALDLPPDVKKTLQLQLVRHHQTPGGMTRIPKAAESNELDRDSSAPANYPDGSQTTPKKGQERWASEGFEKVAKMAPGLNREALMKDPKARQLLINASMLKPGSPQMKNLVAKLSQKGRS